MYVGYSRKEVERAGAVITKLYSGTVSASGDSKSAYKWIPPFISRANLFLKATENSGTATMDVKVVTMHPRVAGHTTDWYDLQAFTQLSATGKEKKSLASGLGDKLAVVWTVTGTGNWTIEVYAELKL
jgi:hypothetical protein